MLEDDERVYRKHAEELTRFATFLVGPSDAPDVVHDAVLATLTSRSWPTVDQPRAYLFRAVLNAARMHHRSTGRRGARERRAAVPEAVEDRAGESDALVMLDGLSSRQRAVIYLTYWDDLDPVSIAVLLGISQGTVRRHLARARATLRRTLDAERPG